MAVMAVSGVERQDLAGRSRYGVFGSVLAWRGGHVLAGQDRLRCGGAVLVCLGTARSGTARSGGQGADRFLIDTASDQVIETSGGGADTIISSVSYTVPAHVEALMLAAGVSGLSLTGSSGSDILIGNGLANNFFGGAGDDVIMG
jgi:hypothetical protein